MSRALVVDALSDDLSTLRMRDVSVPAPKAGEVKIRLRAAAVNFPDILMVQGKYQLKPALPFSPGMEGAGDIVAVGDGVTSVKVGDRVAVGSRFGCYAEVIVVPAEAARPLPKSMDYAHGAAYRAAYLTAYVALVPRGDLQRGETLLVHGAAGGVGLAAVDVGKLLGARVIATASSEEKRAFLRSYGADHVLAPSGFRDEVKALTNGRGADVIYDPVGGDVFDTSLRCLAWEGRLIVVGFAAGRIPQAPANLLLVKNTTVMGLFWGAYRQRNPQVLRDSFAELLSWYAAGKLKPHISHRFAMDQAPQAMAAMLERRSTGKVILKVR